MVDLNRRAGLHEWIEDYLTYLFRTWEGVPYDAAEWDEWDEPSKLNYDVEWGIPEVRLHELTGWAKEGLLTPSQQERYEQLLKLIATNRPILERMLAT